MESSNFLFYCGTVRGVLECTSSMPNTKISFSSPTEASEVTALEWGRSEDEILIGYKNGSVDIYDTIQDKYVKSIAKFAHGDGAIAGLGSVNKSIIVADEGGLITIWNKKKSNNFSISLEEKASLNSMVQHKSRENVIGTGGEFNDFKLWDIETHQCIFRAKSLGHDHLQLPIPTSIRGIAFCPEDDKLSLCATKEGHVLLYDERAQRRPVVKYLEKRASYTCISTAALERQCFVGTTRGYMELIDMKMPGKCIKTFKTFTGSVTSIACDPGSSLVASVSLDRFLRVNNIETKDVVYKMYMKQSLSKLLMKPLVKEEILIPEEMQCGDIQASEVDDEYDELFSKMDTIVENKKKRKSGGDKSSKKKKKKVLSDNIEVL